MSKVDMPSFFIPLCLPLNTPFSVLFGYYKKRGPRKSPQNNRYKKTAEG